MRAWSKLAAVGVQSGALGAGDSARSAGEVGFDKVGWARWRKSGLMNGDGVQRHLALLGCIDVSQSPSQVARRLSVLMSRHLLLRLRSISSKRLRVVCTLLAA